VVVGLPLTLRGERGAQAEETEAFVEALRGQLDVPVETYVERFTICPRTADGGAGLPRTRSPRRICTRAGWARR
jgi:RNase H-fold protein (predicted Holliday junction resolvase)